MRESRTFWVRNFRLGQRRDGALRDDRLWSMRELKNVDIDYTDGRLIIRPGYERWNAEELPTSATQLYAFEDFALNWHLLAISDGKWYVVKTTGSHDILKDEAATAPRPIVQVDNRLIFCTDDGMYWTDDTAIGGATKSYRLGIAPPTEVPAVVAAAILGNMTGLIMPPHLSPVYDFNTTTWQKFAAKLVLAADITLRSFTFGWMWATNATKTGNLRLGLYEDSAGEPGSLVDPNALTDWQSVKRPAALAYEFFALPTVKSVDVSVGTYWVVAETNADYKSNYRGSPTYFYATVAYKPTTPGGLVWNGSAWGPTSNKMGFGVNGLEIDIYYDYKATYYNSTYSIESRPGPKSERLGIVAPGFSSVYITPGSPSDPQVDEMRVYRREIGADPDVTEDSITAEYKLVASRSILYASIYDDISTSALGGVLQTEDHHEYDYIDPEEDSARPVKLAPEAMAWWHDRLIVAVGNEIYLSKVFEQDGATGITNIASPDFFPLGNKFVMPVASKVIAMDTMADDQLMIYFQDGSVWSVWGMVESLNPPPDIQRRDVMKTGGLFAARGIDKTSVRHVIMTNAGLWAVGGTRGIPELLSETNQSILTAIESTYLANSRVLVFGTEIWVLLDTDNDGDLEEILILDMLRDVQSRQILDRAWRTYEYNVPLNDFLVRSRGDTQMHVLAADADNGYILRLGTGSLDHETAITGAVETHNFEARNMVMLAGVEIDAEYPDTDYPTYTIIGYGPGGLSKTITFTPTSALDIREHRAGIGMMAVGDSRLRIEIESTQRDEFKGFLVEYVRE